MQYQLPSDIYKACTILFGPDVQINPDFLTYLQPSGVKSAYRRQAMETHPDRQDRRDTQLWEKSAERFMSANWAYRRLLDYLQNRKYLNQSSLSASSVKRRSHPTASARSGSSPRSGRGDSTGNRTAGEIYYRGKIPDYQMMIGQYLFYAGHVSWESLVRAIIWQRKQRPKLGELARKWGWMSEEQLLHAWRKRKFGEHIGEAAVRLNYLEKVQLGALLYRQRRMQKPFGQFFVEENLLTEIGLQQILDSFQEHNRREFSRHKKTG